MQDKFDKQSIKSLMKEAHIPGGSFANIDAEGSVETLQIGTIAKESTAKVKEDTPLPCASLSKPVFAYLVLKLIEANKTNTAEPGLGKFNTEFDLDTPLYTLFRDKDGQVISDAENPFLKKFHADHQGNAKKITAQMVLSHTTGLHIMGEEPYQFQFEPGTKYAYSGIGIECLQETIKELTGADLETLAKQHIFEPLNMTHSTYGPNPVAANSLITTAEEYAHFIREWINDDTLNYAFNPVPPADSMENDFFPQSEDNPVEAIEVTAEDRKRVAWGMGIGLVKNEQDEVIAAFGTGDMNQARAGFGAIINPQTKRCTEVSTYLANSHNGHMLAGKVLPKTCEPALNNFRIYGFAQNVEQLDGTDFHGLNPTILKPKFQEMAYKTKIPPTLSCKEELQKIKTTERINVDDTRMLVILDKMAKQRKESIAQFQAAARQDLVEQEQFELEIIQRYLPEPLSDAEIQTLIDKAITELSASKISDMGKVMSQLKPQLQGRADLNQVSMIVKTKLS